MSTSAQFASVAKTGIATVSVANTNKDGTGTIGTAFTAGASGSRVDSISIKAIGPTTPGAVSIYLHNGTTAYLLLEITVTASTATGTEKSFEQNVVLGFSIPTGYSVRASTLKSESFNVIVFGGDF